MMKVTDRDHHQSWVAGFVIAFGWLFAGVAIVALIALFAAFGPAAIMGVLR
jgi:predicted benzoate:H+ symporter BenE